MGTAGSRHPDLRWLVATCSTRARPAHNTRGTAGSATPGADRESQSRLPPECVSLLYLAPCTRSVSDKPAAAASRYRVPDLPSRRVRYRIVAAYAVVGPARSAASPIPSDLVVGRARL